MRSPNMLRSVLEGLVPCKGSIMEPHPRHISLVEFLWPFAEQWKSFWARRAAVNELANCDPLQVTGITQDLGISAADLFLIASRDRSAADNYSARVRATRNLRRSLSSGRPQP